jgi:hypothetical protein
MAVVSFIFSIEHSALIAEIGAANVVPQIPSPPNPLSHARGEGGLPHCEPGAPLPTGGGGVGGGGFVGAYRLSVYRLFLSTPSR